MAALPEAQRAGLTLRGLLLLALLAGAACTPGARTADWARVELDLGSEWETPSGPVELPDVGQLESPRSSVVYRKRFRLPVDRPRPRAARVRLEGAICTADVTLNGQSLGSARHPGLLTAFDASEALRWGGDNDLQIEVRDAGSLGLTEGLYRVPERPDSFPEVGGWGRARLEGPCELILTGDPCLEAVRVTPSWRRRELALSLAVHSASPLEATLEATVGGASSSRLLQLEAGSTDVEWTLPSGSAAPWGVAPHGSPELTALSLRLRARGAVTDELVVPFGFREVWVEPGALEMNGEELFLWSWRDSPGVDGRFPLEKMHAVSEAHGFVGWHLHSGATRSEVFRIADEVGRYLTPGLLCAGAWKTDRSAYAPADAAFLDGYFRAWVRAYGGHPSIVAWAQEVIGPHWDSAYRELEFDRPAYGVDLAPVSGTMEQFTARIDHRPDERLADRPLVLHELEQPGESTPAQLEAFLLGLPLGRLWGAQLRIEAEPVTAPPSLRSIYQARTGREPGRVAPTILPRVSVAGRAVLGRPYAAAPGYLRGGLADADGRVRLLPGEEGPMPLRLDGRAAEVVVDRVPYSGPRPVVEGTP